MLSYINILILRKKYINMIVNSKIIREKNVNLV